MTSDETCKCGGRCGGVTPSEPYAQQVAGFAAYRAKMADANRAVRADALQQSLVGVVGTACACPPMWHATHAPTDHWRANATDLDTGVVATDIRGVYSARSREATNVLGGVQSHARTFTREEVLTVLRTCVALNTTMAEAVRVFERME